MSPPRLPLAPAPATADTLGDTEEAIAVREEFLSKFQKHLKPRAPAGGSGDPEEALQGRMVKMEAELTALREALSSRVDKAEGSAGSTPSATLVNGGGEVGVTRPLQATE